MRSFLDSNVLAYTDDAGDRAKQANILAAIDLVRLHSVSFWDALIVRAAQVSRCSVLYSEDMRSGWSIDAFPAGGRCLRF